MTADLTTITPALVGWCPVSEIYVAPYTGPRMVCDMDDCLQTPYNPSHYYHKRRMYICPNCKGGYSKREDFLNHVCHEFE